MVDLLPALMPLVSRVRQDITWRKVGHNTRCERGVPLSKQLLRLHLRGIAMCGVCPIEENSSTTRVAVLDLDSHKGETTWLQMRFVISRVCTHFAEAGFEPIAFRSTGGRGAHLFFIWGEPQDAYSVRCFLREHLEKMGFKDGTKGVKANEIEVFPKQDSVPKGGCGNQFILPLAGESVPLEPLLDYDPVERANALDINWQDLAPVPVKERPTLPPQTQRQYDCDLTVLKSALDKIDPNSSYDHWVRIGMGIHAESDGSADGFNLWDDWSSGGGDLYPGSGELQKKWDSFRSDKETLVTSGFIKKLAAENGWNEDYSGDFDNVSSMTPDDVLSPDEDHGRFTPIPAKKFMARPSPKWIIKGVLPEKSTGMTFGGSGDGKTFAVLDMACAIALGKTWNGRRVKQQHVIYICAEGAGGFITRMRAYAQFHKVPSLNDLSEFLSIIPAAPNFLKKDDIEELIKEINLYNKNTGLIIIDTMAQTTTGADENSAKDMNIALKYLEVLRSRVDCAVHLIHHAGKDEDRGARGSSTLKAALDVQFQISRDGNRRLFWVSKMKDGPDGFGWNFELLTENLGLDDEQDMISSCIVKFEDKATETKRVVKKKRGPWETAILKTWDALGGRTMAIDDIIEEVKNNTPRDGGKRDRRVERIGRAFQSLCADGEITVRNGQIVSDLTI